MLHRLIDRLFVRWDIETLINIPTTMLIGIGLVIFAFALATLRTLDQIAYIRFASVYQSFEDLEALKREVDSLYADRDQLVAIDLRPKPANGKAR